MVTVCRTLVLLLGGLRRGGWLSDGSCVTLVDCDNLGDECGPDPVGVADSSDDLSLDFRRRSSGRCGSSWSRSRCFWLGDVLNGRCSFGRRSGSVTGTLLGGAEIEGGVGAGGARSCGMVVVGLVVCISALKYTSRAEFGRARGITGGQAQTTILKGVAVDVGDVVPDLVVQGVLELSDVKWFWDGLVEICAGGHLDGNTSSFWCTVGLRIGSSWRNGVHWWGIVLVVNAPQVNILVAVVVDDS